MLLNTEIYWKIRDQEDVLFISNVIRDHKNPKMINLEFHSQENQYNLEDLVEVVESSQIRQLELKKADSAEVNLSPLLRALKKMISLDKLTLFTIMPLEFDALAHALENCHLKKLHLFSPKLQPAALWTAIIPVLSAHLSLKTLFVLKIGPAECQALGQLLQRNRSIQQLTVDSHATNDITDEDIMKFVGGLKSNATLKALSWYNVDDGCGTSMNGLFEALRDNTIKISELRMIRANLYEDNVKTLAEALKTNTTLQTLVLREFTSRVLNDTCQILIDGLSQNTNITSLEISVDKLDIDRTTEFFNYLRQNKSLTSLDLSTCTSAASALDRNSQLIADLLIQNTTLKVLKLDRNHFGDEGAKHICEAMTKNTTLRELCLKHVKITVDGFTAIKNMLLFNTNLKKLTISHVEAESTELICQGLQCNTSLTHLVIHSVKPSEICMTRQRQLVKLLELHNFALDTIEFTFTAHKLYNVKPDESTAQLKQLVRRNRQLKSEARFKVAILSHNIARSHQALAMLPRELWLDILSRVTHTGMDPFTNLAKNIFYSYSDNVIRKQ